MCTYHKEKKIMWTPTVMAVGGWGWEEEGEEQVGVLCGCRVGWLVGLHWRVGDAWRRWSHMCGSWYFPRFLFRGSCTQMNIIFFSLW